LNKNKMPEIRKKMAGYKEEKWLDEYKEEYGRI
jgi:hypothetical protein